MGYLIPTVLEKSQFGDPEAAAKLIDADKLKENIESSLRNQKALEKLEELAGVKE